MNAATVAVATTCSVALRKPEMTSGRASGHSTLPTICPSVIPSARAACTASRSAPAMPAAVAVKIDGRARMASTTTMLTAPVPSSITARNSRPRVGMARAALLSADHQEGAAAGVADQDAQRDGDTAAIATAAPV